MTIVGEAVVVIKGKDEFSSTVGKAVAPVLSKVSEQTQSLTSKIGTGMQTAGATISGIGDKMSTHITLPFVAAAGGMVAWGIKTAGALEQSRIGFETMLGSGQKADAMIKDLQKFAAATPFEFQGLVSSSQQLLAMGFNAKDIIPTMTAVGNAVAAMGGTEENVAAVTRALGQMQAKGKASSEEMLQLTEQGIPAWKFLAEEMGVSTQVAMKRVADGQVSASTAINAVVRGSNREFGGLMEKQSKTLQGQMSNLQDTISQNLGAALADSLPKITAIISELTKQIGPLIQSLIPVFEQLLNTIIPVVKALVTLLSAFNNLDPGIQKIIISFGLLVVAMGPIMSIGGRVISTMGSVVSATGTAATATKAFAAPGGGLDTIRLGFMYTSDAIKSAGAAVMQWSGWSKIAGAATKVWTGIQAAFNAVMALNPIVLIVVAVAALIAALVILYIKWKPFHDLVNQTAVMVKDFFIKAWDAAKNAVRSFVTFFGQVWKVLVDIVKKYGLILVAVIAPFIGIPLLIIQHWGKITEFFQRVLGKLKEVVDKAFDKIIDYFKALPGKMSGALGNMWSKISSKFIDLFNTMRERLTSFLSNYIDFWRNLPNRMFSALGNMWAAISGKFTAMFDSLRSRTSGFIDNFLDFWRNLPERMSSALGNMWAAISSKFTDLISSARSKASSFVETVKNVVGGLPEKAASALSNLNSQVGGAISRGLSGMKSRVTGAFSGAGSWLYSIGSSILSGLTSGIMSKLSDLQSKVSSIGGKIKSWKGPPEVDRVLLHGTGQLIMGGLMQGIESSLPNLQTTLGKVTNTIAGTNAAISGGIAATNGVGAGRTVNLFPDSTVIMAGPADADEIIKRIEIMVAGSRL